IPIPRNKTHVKPAERPSDIHVFHHFPTSDIFFNFTLKSQSPLTRVVLPCPYPTTTHMLFKTRSAAVYGIEAYLVDVEVNISTGGNGEFVIVGLPDAAVRESRNRVVPAIRNNGFGSPYQR